jgi:hypothetical protein
MGIISLERSCRGGIIVVNTFIGVNLYECIGL